MRPLTDLINGSGASAAAQWPKFVARLASSTGRDIEAWGDLIAPFSSPLTTRMRPLTFSASAGSHSSRLMD